MSSDNNDASLANYIALPLLAFFLCWGSWHLYGTSVLGFAFQVSAGPFELFAHLPTFLLPSGAPEEFRAVAAETRNANPSMYGWETFKQILGLWGYTLRLVLIPALIVVAAMSFRLPVNYYYRRSLNLRKLAEQNSELFPCTKPALGKDLHKTFAYDGPWRVADDYIDFASFNGLLLYKGKPIAPTTIKDRGLSLKKKRKLFPHFSYVTIDKAKTDALFVNQLGKPWRGTGGLSPLHKGLMAAFMACTAGGDYRQQGRDLLDQLSRSFVEGDPASGVTHKIDLTGVDDLISAVQTHEDVLEAIEGHAFESTVFISLLVSGREKTGKIPPSAFLWLRPTDRTLWYSLHPIGGRKPWVEGAAAWNHYFAEQDLGRGIATPVIEGASDSLESELYGEKWIFAQGLSDIEAKERQEEQRLLEEAAKAMASTPKAPRKRR